MPMKSLGAVGFKPKGMYSDTATYTRLDVVDAFGGSYLALRTMTGISPVKNTTDENWQCLTNSGKTAYEYAKDGGYPGTEIEFYALLASINNVATDSEADEYLFGTV